MSAPKRVKYSLLFTVLILLEGLGKFFIRILIVKKRGCS